MRVKILGGGREVGRAAILVEDAKTRVLLDYGVLINNGRNREPLFPLHVRPRDVDGLVLTHAHLDHNGAMPLLYSGYKGLKAYATRPTIQLTELLLHDFLKVSGNHLPFTTHEVDALIHSMEEVTYKHEFTIGNLSFSLLDAGHIPGSGMVYVEGSKKLLYTGDINRRESSLLTGHERDLPEVDVVITENTYSDTDHPDRSNEEKMLIEFAKEVVEREGTLLIPAFAVGRAQEVATILYRHRFPYTVYMDGMALTVNTILLSNPEYLKNPYELEAALNNLDYVVSWSMRKRVVEEPCVIISPAGMLVGGAAVFYNKVISSREENGIAIVAYQAPETPGRKLLDEKVVIEEGGRRKRVKAEVRRFNLSAHSGRKELLEFITKDVKGDPLIVLVHGEEEKTIRFSTELRELGFKVVTPGLGDVVEVR